MEKKSSGMRLLKKGQNGVLKMIFSRMGIVLLLLALNILLLFAAFGWFREFLPHFFGGTALFTVCMVIFLINSRMDPTAKITWLVVIMLLPVFGSLLYLYTCKDFGHRALGKRLQKIYASSKRCDGDIPALESLSQRSHGAAAMARYVSGNTGIPIHGNTRTTYFSSGEEMLVQMLKELEKAQSTIYLEYFIVDEGEMWGSILEILARKAAAGVDVRLMYDGTCEFFRLPKGYKKKLGNIGIKCRVFSPITPFLSTHYNYRDHRKILTIDGKVAFTGGINLSDEYINVTHPHGYWKDAAIMLEGDGAKSFEKMFLQIWQLEDREITDLNAEAPSIPLHIEDGFVMSYCEDPLDSEQVARQVYIDILNRAKSYVHIMTPYLIMDGGLESALEYAAKRGVDVAMLLPGISDNIASYALAKSHYARLTDAGVKLYEYSPGFVHAKVLVADDIEAVVGTVNFDYRSLYHNFECAVYMYGVSCIADIVKDFDISVAKSRNVTKESIKKEKLFYKIGGKLLKLLAPLM